MAAHEATVTVFVSSVTAPFRANADKVYGASDMAKAWDKKLLDEVAAVR